MRTVFEIYVARALGRTETDVFRPTEGDAVDNAIEQTTLIQTFVKAKVVPNPADIEQRVRTLSAQQPLASPPELSKGVISSTTKRMSGLGVVAALPGVVPGLGTGAQIAVTSTTAGGELWVILRNLTAMHLTVAGLYGHDVRHPERHDELVIVWGLETGLIIPAAEAGKRVGTKVAIKQFNQHVSGALLRRINQKLGTTVVTKWGTKRGGIALGKLIPLGVGTAVGGGMNYLAARSFGTALMRYYDDLLPSDADVIVVE